MMKHYANLDNPYFDKMLTPYMGNRLRAGGCWRCPGCSCSWQPLWRGGLAFIALAAAVADEDVGAPIFWFRLVRLSTPFHKFTHVFLKLQL
ncbi:MAG: hypothetical protein A2Y51_03350 [Gallionellales bacterium RIFCSPLOWO2_02_60_31]|nr:MAG: hypothetical protein A2Y51_03350 [Gallionellales bacterium RIFCSPLOWO2_02_60_31]